MIEVVIQGLLLGGLYALFALGLSLMFGVMRLTNTAQGDFIVLAAFGAIAAVSMLAWSPWLAGAVLLPLSFAFGYAVQRWVLNGTLIAAVKSSCMPSASSAMIARRPASSTSSTVVRKS